MAREKRLRPLRHYLRELDSQKAAPTRAILAGFRSLKREGLPITISKVPIPHG